MIKRSAVLVLAVLALGACDTPQSSSPARADKDAISGEKYERDREACRSQANDYMRGRLLAEDTRRDVMRGENERYGRSEMTTQMANYGDTRTYDAAVGDCMQARGWPQQQKNWWQRIGQPHTF
jgi:hypothetical protein